MNRQIDTDKTLDGNWIMRDDIKDEPYPGSHHGKMGEYFPRLEQKLTVKNGGDFKKRRIYDFTVVGTTFQGGAAFYSQHRFLETDIGTGIYTAEGPVNPTVYLSEICYIDKITGKMIHELAFRKDLGPNEGKLTIERMLNATNPIISPRQWRCQPE